MNYRNNWDGMILDRADRQGYPIQKAIELIKNNLKEKKNSCLEAFESFVLSSEEIGTEGEKNALNERDVGLIGNSQSGLRMINKFDNDDIRGVLIFIQDWELRNKLRDKEETKINI